MRVLYLPLKKEWYEMIEAGIKTEEYREFKPYWVVRLLIWNTPLHILEEQRISLDSAKEICSEHIDRLLFTRPIYYDSVCFSCGYTRRRMRFKCKGITIGRGRPEWGAPDYDTFIIKLGRRLL